MCKKLKFNIALLFLFFLIACGGGGGNKKSAISTDLSDLSLEFGSIAQVFQSAQFSYTTTVGSLQSTISITPTEKDTRSQIHVNGILVVSGQASHQIPLEHGFNTIFITVTSPDNVMSTYVLTVQRLEYQSGRQQGGIFKASNTGINNLFGVSVALDGDTLAISSPFEVGSPGVTPNNREGAVYIFTFSNNVWRGQARLTASNAEAGDRFGESIALQGDTLVVGAQLEDGVNNTLLDAGAVYVFNRSVFTWNETAILRASNAGANDLLGSSITISGDTLVVGAPGQASNAGAVLVYKRSGTTWTEQALLKASNADVGDSFGGSVAIDGDTLVVGAKREDSNSVIGASDNSVIDSGAAYVFTRSNTLWTEALILKASNGEGLDLTHSNGDQFGYSVAISLDTIAVGARWEDSSIAGAGVDNLATDAGAVYLFKHTSGGWSEQQLLKASNADAGDEFGVSLALRGNTLIVGAWLEDSRLSIGLDDNFATDSGIAYVFDQFQNVWSEQKTFKPTNSDPSDLFGTSVAISFDRLAVGAIGEDSLLSNPGVSNSVPNSGAAYIF